MVTDKRTSPSLKERRLETLRRTGVADRHRVATEKPSAAFYWIFIIVSSFVMLGLVMVLSSSSVTNLHSGGSAWGMFQRQLVWAGLGGIAMWAAFAFPYETWRKTFLLQSVVASVVLLNVLVILRGALVNGARAWLDMGPFRMQPSEFMKIAVVLFCANLLSHRHRSVQISSIVLWPMIVALGVSAGLCALQKDFGGSFIFGGIVLVMMIIDGLPKRQVFTTTIVLLVSGAFVLKFAGNASARMLAFMDLEGTKEDGGYQVYQSLLSIANGGWSGTGIGSGTSKWGYVPLAYSDFIFSVIAEELGIFGSLMVIGGFLALVVFGLQVALSAPDTHGAFIAGGISAWFGVQALVNIGGVVGALPMTGLTLPFLSYGGSLGSGVLNAMVADLLLALAGTHSVVYHICGERFVRDQMPHVPAGVQYIRVGYEDRMADVYSALDVLVSRAGASSVAEIATVGVASILVPWPDAADGHQELNARWLTDAGAGILVDDASCADGRAVAQVTQLLANQNRVTELARSAYQLGALHRSSALVDAIEGAARATIGRGTMDD